MKSLIERKIWQPDGMPDIYELLPVPSLCGKVISAYSNPLLPSLLLSELTKAILIFTVQRL